MSDLAVASVVGNPRPESRTHGVARTLVEVIGAELGTEPGPEIDLAALGARTLDPADPGAITAVMEVLEADVLVVASPTYKATYSGLLKSFLDRIGTGALAGRTAVPVLLGGAANHQLAVDVHFTPLLLELGAAVPVRGLFVVEAELEQFPATARAWAHRHAAELVPALRRSLPLEASNQ
ncbi:MAG TPA: NAD(P)H-dependent oxidoreductase [Solirubrobacteraceae bacterium]|nr:NAD(P)H-dependent oxidoreductase [Solirubrobacteraceae bacterium]